MKRYITPSPSVVGAGSEEEGRDGEMLGAGANDIDRKSTRLNSSHPSRSRMPSSA